MLLDNNNNLPNVDNYKPRIKILLLLRILEHF